MSVVYPTQDDPEAVPQTGGLIGFVNNHLFLSIGAGLVLAVIIGYIVHAVTQGTTSTTAQTTQQPTTLYVPTSNTFINKSVQDTTNTTTTTNNQSPNDIELGTVRAKQTSAAQPYYGYDKSAKGVPIRSQAADGNNVTKFVPWGSSLNLIGPAIPGSSNTLAGQPGTSTDWYQVVGGGYISLADLATAPTPAGALNLAPIMQPMT